MGIEILSKKAVATEAYMTFIIMQNCNTKESFVCTNCVKAEMRKISGIKDKAYI